MANETKKKLHGFVRRFETHLAGEIKTVSEQDTGKPIRIIFSKKKVIIRASSVGTCLRYLHYYRKKGPPPEDPAFASRLFNGVILHDALELIIAKMPGIKVIALDNVHFRKFRRTVHERDGWKVVVTGTPDVLLEYKGLKLILDFKGLSRWNMDTFNDSTLTEHFIHQLNSYCAITGADGAVLAARSKETGEMKYKVFPYDPDMLKTFCGKVLDQLIFWKGTPQRGFPMDTFFCKWCPYRDECWLLTTSSKKEYKLPKKVRTVVKHLLKGYVEARDAKRTAEELIGKIKKDVANLLEQRNAKTLYLPEHGYVQVRQRPWTRLEFSKKLQKRLDEMDAAKEALVKRWRKKGKVKETSGTTSSIWVVPQS